MIWLTYKNKFCVECGIVFEPKSSKSKCCCKDCSYKNKRKKFFNYKNLQPLWAIENLSKGGRI